MLQHNLYLALSAHWPLYKWFLAKHIMAKQTHTISYVRSYADHGIHLALSLVNWKFSNGMSCCCGFISNSGLSILSFNSILSLTSPFSLLMKAFLSFLKNSLSEDYILAYKTLLSGRTPKLIPFHSIRITNKYTLPSSRL